MREPICRKCGSFGDIPAYRLRKGDYCCRSCMRAENTARRRAAGKPPRVFRGPGKRHQVRKHDPAKTRARYLDPANAPKRKAREVAGYAIRSGRLTRQPCEVCGSTPSEAHHDDYSKPLDVRWLCVTHHREHHAALAKRAA